MIILIIWQKISSVKPIISDLKGHVCLFQFYIILNNSTFLTNPFIIRKIDPRFNVSSFDKKILMHSWLFIWQTINLASMENAIKMLQWILCTFQMKRWLKDRLEWSEKMIWWWKDLIKTVTWQYILAYDRNKFHHFANLRKIVNWKNYELDTSRWRHLIKLM